MYGCGFIKNLVIFERRLKRFKRMVCEESRYGEQSKLIHKVELLLICVYPEIIGMRIAGAICEDLVFHRAEHFEF